MKKLLRFLLLLLLISGLSEKSFAQNYSLQKIDLDRDFLHPPCLFVDGADVLIGSAGGVYRVDPSGATALIYSRANGLLADTVRKIDKDAQGNMWLQTDLGVAVKRDTWQFYNNNRSQDWSTQERFTLLKSIDGEVWIGHSTFAHSQIDKNELYQFKSDGTVITHSVQGLNSEVVEMVKSSKGTYLAAGLYNFAVLENGAWKFKGSYQGNQRLASLCADKEGTIYSGGYTRFYQLKDGATDFEEVTNDLLSQTDVTEVLSDDGGRLLLRTYSSVIVKDHESYYGIDKALGIANGYIWDLTTSSTGAWLIMVDYSNWKTIIYNIKFDLNTNNLMKGIVFNDLNADGMQNNGEPGVKNQFVKLSPGNFMTITNDDGAFYFAAHLGENTLTWKPKQFWQQGSTPVSYIFNYPADSAEVFKIGLQQDIVHDVGVSVTGQATRPGFDTRYYVQVRNEGSQSETPTITFQYDDALTFKSSSIAPDSESGNVLTWNMPSISSLKDAHIDISFNLNQTTPIGADLFSQVSVSNLAGETDLNDNIDSLHQIVTGSLDPNDKLVREGIFEEKYVEIGSALTYTIRFQNTGTDTAFVVKVKDTLDINLNINSLEVLDASHAMTYFLDGRTMYFIFDDILLPDSTRNEPASHGYLKYRIQNESNILNGTDVTNSAAIYFDFNQPVLTNVTSNRYVNALPNGHVLGTETVMETKSFLYPNPAKDFVMISKEYSGTFHTASLMTTHGTPLGQQTIDRNGKITLPHLNSGIYLMRLQGKNKIAVCKLMIVSEK
jgi:uncharacterized repeat protein (TIGR01451 family)